MPFIPEAALLPIMIGTTVAAGAVSAAGAMEQANATENQMNYQSAVAQQNRNYDIQQSNRELQLGTQAVQREGMKTRAELGGIIADEGAAGLELQSGSNALVQDSARKLGQFNEMIAYNDAQARSTDYLVKGFSDEASRNLYAFGAKQAPVAGAFQAGGALLSGASTAAVDYARFGGLGGPQRV
jgi:hypothetical protein